MDRPKIGSGHGTADPAERRVFPRHQIQIPGRVKAADGMSRACMVRDYCNGGALLQLGEPGNDEPGAAVGGKVRLDIQLLDVGGPRRLRIEGQIAWARGLYAGIAFTNPSTTITTALQAYDREKNTGLTDRGAPRRMDLTNCLARLRYITASALPDLAQEILNDTLAGLPAAADGEESIAARQRIWTESQTLEGAEARELLAQVLLTRAFDACCRPPQPEPEPSSGGFALVELDDFERWLEVSRITALLASRVEFAHTTIGARLLGADGGRETDRLPALVAPQLLASAIDEFARQLELCTPTRQVLFESSLRVMCDRLPPLYRALDAELDILGIPAASPPRERLATGCPNAARRSPVRRTGDRPRKGRAAHLPSRPSADQPTRDQDAAISEPGSNLVHEMMARIGDTIGLPAGRPDWLAQLEGPLIAETRANPGFFQDHDHPLRAIIDGLAHLQLFRNSADASPAEQGLRQRLAALLEPVRDGRADSAALHSMVAAIAALTMELSRRYQRRVELLNAACEARDLTRRARQAVADELNRRYADAPVPAMVPELLDMGWRALLERDWLNGRGGSGPLEARLALLDALIGALGGRAVETAPPPPPADLLERVLDTLGAAAFDPFRRTAMEARLRRALLAPGDGPAPTLVTMPIQEDGRDAPDATGCPDGLSDEAWAQALARCAAIRPGDRLRLLDEPQERCDLRVAWVREDRGLFVLVDPRGLKACDLARADLALGLHRGRILVSSLDGRPMTNRMLDAMLEDMEARLPHLSPEASFTGLANRRGFHAALDQALAGSDRSWEGGVMLMVDVDHFRLINAIHGYETGDRLLIALAQVLRQSIGAGTFGHLGGDRFAVLLPEIAVPDGERLAERLCVSVRDMPFDWPGDGGRLSISIGLVGTALAQQGLSTLWQAAEQATRAAKHRGGDQVYTYRDDDPDMIEHRESIHWVAEVDRALDGGQLRLRCQPIVPLQTAHDLRPHYEVLLGVTNTLHEPLSIAHFISAAERYKRMRAVDRWVARTVIEWIAEHRAFMTRFHNFAVNLSGQTASDPTFVDFVREHFRRHAVDPAWVSFEITETAAVADLSVSSGILRDLKALGCHTALDDFGSGLASYSYLRALPVDWVKIDGAFVRRIGADRNDFAVVKSINDMGHILGKRTIAEYVADSEILRCVTEIGVDFGQGFGISPPLLMDELLERTESPATA